MLAEGFCEIIGVGETAGCGDVGDGGERVVQEDAGAFHTYRGQLLQEGASHRLHEARLQEPAGDATVPRDVGDLDVAFGEVIEDVAAGAGHERILVEAGRGRLSARDVGGLHQNTRVGRDGVAAHQRVQETRGLEAGAVRVHRDAAEGGLAEFAEQGIVVDAEHHHVVGHAQADVLAGFDDVPSALIHRREDAKSARCAREPVAEAADVRFPRCAAGRAAVDVAGESVARGQFGEGFAAGG